MSCAGLIPSVDSAATPQLILYPIVCPKLTSTTGAVDELVEYGLAPTNLKCTANIQGDGHNLIGRVTEVIFWHVIRVDAGLFARSASSIYCLIG